MLVTGSLPDTQYQKCCRPALAIRRRQLRSGTRGVRAARKQRRVQGGLCFQAVLQRGGTESLDKHVSVNTHANKMHTHTHSLTHKRQIIHPLINMFTAEQR